MMRRREPGNVGLGLCGTALVHGFALLFLLSAASGARSAPPMYRVHLVAAPEPGQETRRAPEAVQREAEQPLPAVPTKRPPPANTVSRAAPPPVADAVRREAAPRTTPQAQPLPGETPSTGNDVATISLEGVQFPFPEYEQNIISQVLRRWQRPPRNSVLEAEVSFFIHRDGSVTGLQFIRRSGNFGFDLEAQGAIEEAGRLKAFGPLPDGWPADVLYVRFYFSPRR
jgi:outer membrane biosynthesis protein TonB